MDNNELLSLEDYTPRLFIVKKEEVYCVVLNGEEITNPVDNYTVALQVMNYAWGILDKLFEGRLK